MNPDASHQESHPLLTILGVGPGDPDLITVKGLKALQTADVIFAPVAAENKPSIALDIVREWLRPEQRIIPILTPMVRDKQALTQARRRAAETIVRALQPDRRGAYIILGDPMLYGTFTPIAEHLRALAPTIQQRIVPGVTAISAAAAATETPLASGSERLAVLPGLRERSRNGLIRLLRGFAHVAIMKAGPAFPMLTEVLDEAGLLEQTVYVEHVGLPGERIVYGKELKKMPAEKRPYLSLMLVHNPHAKGAGSHRRAESGARTYPAHLINLAQKRIVVVGGGPVGERKVRGLLAAGAQPILISPQATEQLRAWRDEGRIQWLARAYETLALLGADMVFAATDDAQLNARIAADAAAAGAWCNVADDANLGDFHVPAVHRTQGLVISVGSEGRAPARAASVRDRIAHWLRTML